ncbi:MAG: DUF3422 domain-containing protein [Rhodovarius sp.]|nr:DUF3422 domain-containing protein [Rhodovarius sp.]
MKLPAEYARRAELNFEVHARPPDALAAPLRISYLALLLDSAEREAARAHVRSLALRYGATPPGEGANHWAADLGTFRVKWEQHTEFHRVTFMRDGAGERPFTDPAIAVVPEDWVAALPGRLIVASDLELLQDADESLAIETFGAYQLVGSMVQGGRGMAFTDFRIGSHGFSRFLVHAGSMSAVQAGRNVQRLLEIDTYRMMALLALPVARALGPALTRWEGQLAEIAARLVEAKPVDEPDLLARLTGLAAEIEKEEAATRYRFSAAAAYYALVQRRIAELREERIEGLQTFREFVERRLAPAMDTCQSTAARQEALSRRVARVTQLLSTRVDLTREEQNRALLQSMDRRARLQLRLQRTVEGLSVAAISYYIVGLVSYAAKALAPGLAIDPDRLTALAIPIVLVLVGVGLARARRHLKLHDED